MTPQQFDFLIYFFDKIVLATFVGTISSGIFLYILSRFRPNIEIAPVIAKGCDTNNEKTLYRIKVINRTKSPIVDVKAQLHILKNHQTATGSIYKSSPIKLKRSHQMVIDGYDKSDSDANYAYRFVTYSDLEINWVDDNVQFLRFRIFARHSISGFGKLVYKDFRLKRNSIKGGEFSKGDSFEII
jgi:hypothetical protein